MNNSAPFNDINNRICHYSVTPAFTVNGPSSATNLTPPDGVMCKSHQIFASSPASVAASIASIVASGISRSTVLVGTPSSVVTDARSEEHTSELQSLMRISYAVFCLKKKKQKQCHYTHRPI